MALSKVLLIEDNLEDALITRDSFEKKGCFVEVVDDGEAAVKRVHSLNGDAPDLILLDLYLPKRTGFEVLSEIEKNPALGKVPVVIQTASSATEHDLKNFHKRLDGCIHKPVEWEECMRVLEEKKAENSGLPIPF